MNAVTAFQERLQVALLAGRGELLKAGALPASEEDVRALVDAAVMLINGAAEQHAKRARLEEAAGQLLGAIRSGVAMQLADILALCEPDMAPNLESEAFRLRKQEIKSTLLHQHWPIDATEV